MHDVTTEEDTRVDCLSYTLAQSFRSWSFYSLLLSLTLPISYLNINDLRYLWVEIISRAKMHRKLIIECRYQLGPICA